MNASLTMNRRGLLKGAGFLSLAFALAPRLTLAQAAAPELPGDLEDFPFLDSWIRINADGTVKLLFGKVELGQGIVTAFAQIAAEELDVDLARLDITSGDTRVVPDQGTTAGSNSMSGGGPALQVAAAEVRQALLNLASAKLGAPVEGMTVADGTITAANGASTTYWELVTGEELHVNATGTAPMKAPADYKIIGQPIIRLDIPGMMAGEPTFLHEVRLDGMVHGRIVRPPTYSASLTAIETAAVEGMPGVLSVVRDGSFLGVVAERQDQAVKAANALAAAAQWQVEAKLPGHDGMEAWLLAATTKDVVHKEQARTSGGEPAKWVEASYYRPYHMHASLGTSAAIATLNADGSYLVQTHSQSVFATAETIAALLGIDAAMVHCQHIQGAGCYGHNMADDVAADAALLARSVPGRPVRLQYTRDQEHKWEPYGSAMVIKTRAGLDADGNVLDWQYDLWSTPHGARPGGSAGDFVSGWYLAKATALEGPENPGGGPSYNTGRNAIAPYEFPGNKVTDHFIKEMPLRVSSTRGLGAYANVFANESFIDELAHEAGVDPLEYRLRFLPDERARAVLNAAAEKFGWASWEKKEGRGRGLAYARYKNFAAMAAVALEVDVNRRNGRVRVIRAVTAADVGQAVNPDGVRNQIEGGFIQALSWTMKEEVKFDDTRIFSEDWASYPILTFQEVPPVEFVLLDQPGQPYLGTGEACCGQAGAAVANAIFDAVGIRFRRLPFTPDRIKAGLA